MLDMEVLAERLTGCLCFHSLHAFWEEDDKALGGQSAFNTQFEC